MEERCNRKNHRALTVDEQNRFLNAFTQINSMNALVPLVDIHANAIHQMHSNPRFLPWHRIYLLRIEELLQMVDPTVCIPYWNSSVEQAFPAWLLGFTPTVNLMGRPTHGDPKYRCARDFTECGRRDGGDGQRYLRYVLASNRRHS